ncbi:MAG TPA: RidA family protein [Rhodopila sp.]|nr:RidA family protein [Rhodopila sp.]
MPAIERLMLDGQPTPVSHYCHVTKAGSLVWVSGTVGMRADNSIPDDVVEQFEVAIANLDACLKAAGASAEGVVKVTVFLTSIADRARINPVRQRYFGANRPASTLVEVSALVHPALKVEIEAQAVLP